MLELVKLQDNFKLLLSLQIERLKFGTVRDRMTTLLYINRNLLNFLLEWILYLFCTLSNLKLAKILLLHFMKSIQKKQCLFEQNAISFKIIVEH